MNAYEGKKLSANTVKLYNSALTSLLGKGFDSLEPLKDFEGIKQKIEMKKSPSTKRSYYSAIVTALKGKDDFKETYDKAHLRMMSVNKSLPLSDTKSKTQEKNWTSFTDLLELRDDMEAAVTKKLKKEKKEVTPQTYNELLDVVILSLYTLQEPRRSQDYTQMVLGRPLRDGVEPEKMNYIDKNTFVFNNYKTSGTYHSQTVQVTEPMQRVLKMYLKYHNKSDAWFLIRADGKHIDTSPQLTVILNRITGKNISTSMIRNIFASHAMKDDKHEYKQLMSKLEQVAGNMGTSVQVLLGQYTKQ